MGLQLGQHYVLRHVYLIHVKMEYELMVNGFLQTMQHNKVLHSQELDAYKSLQLDLLLL